MNDFLNKFGYYELISYLLSGIYEVLFAVFIMIFSFQQEFTYTNIKAMILNINSMNFSAQTIILILLIALFCGMIFSELGDCFKPLLRKYYDTKFFKLFVKQEKWSVNNLELNFSKEYIAQKYNNSSDEITEDYIFNYANTYLNQKSKAFIRKAQTLSSLFRGIIVYTIIQIIILLLLSLFLSSINFIFITITIISLLILSIIVFPIIENKYRSILRSFTIRRFVIEIHNVNSLSDT